MRTSRKGDKPDPRDQGPFFPVLSPGNPPAIHHSFHRAFHKQATGYGRRAAGLQGRDEWRLARKHGGASDGIRSPSCHRHDRLATRDVARSGESAIPASLLTVGTPVARSP